MGLSELTPEDIKGFSDENLDTLHARIHAVSRVSDEQALLATSHDFIEAEYATRGVEHSTPFVARNLTGVYLKDPHGRLIYDGKKTSIALNRVETAIVGDHLVVSKESGVGLAYGWASIAPPQEITSEAFDALFDSHRVTTTEHEKWWKGNDKLYLYPITAFKPYPDPKQVDVPAGIQLAMESVRFIEPEAKAVQEDPMPYSMDNVPRPAKNWTEEEQRKCVDAANAVLAKKGTEQDAIFACIRAAGKTEHPGGDKDIEPELEKEVTAPEQETLEAPSETDREPEVEVKGDPASETVQDISEKIAVAFAKNMAESFAKLAVERHAEVEPVQETVSDPEPAVKEVEPGTNVDPINDTIAEFTPDVVKEVVAADLTDDKAGRRVRRSMLERLKEAFATLKDIIGWAEESDQPNLPKLKELPMVFKSLDGSTDYFIIWPTNSYKDREHETFHAKAIHDFVNRMDDADIKSVAEFWHLSQTKFGNIIWQDVVEDRFLVQIGVFDDSKVGAAFKAFFTKYPGGHPVLAPEGWGASHGYHYIDADRKDGEYEWFHTNESSVLPRRYAANVFNPSPTVVTLGGKEMNARDEALQLISKEVGVDLASFISAEARTYKEALDETVEHKAKKEPVQDEEELDEEGNPIKKDEKPKDEKPAKKDVEVETETVDESKTVETPVAEVAPEPAPEPTITPELVKQIVEAFGKSYGMSELGDHIAQQNEMLAGLKTQLDAANTKIAELEKSTEEKVAESVAILPRFPWMQSFQSSTAKETELSDTDPSDLALKASIPAPANSPVAQLTKNM